MAAKQNWFIIIIPAGILGCVTASISRCQTNPHSGTESLARNKVRTTYILTLYSRKTTTEQLKATCFCIFSDCICAIMETYTVHISSYGNHKNWHSVHKEHWANWTRKNLYTAARIYKRDHGLLLFYAGFPAMSNPLLANYQQRKRGEKSEVTYIYIYLLKKKKTQQDFNPVSDRLPE